MKAVVSVIRTVTFVVITALYVRTALQNGHPSDIASGVTGTARLKRHLWHSWLDERPPSPRKQGRSCVACAALARIRQVI